MSDGTEQGTELVADLAPGEDVTGAAISAVPRTFAGGPVLAFVAAYQGVWATDGTPGGTEQLAPAHAGTPIRVIPGRVPGDPPRAFFNAGENQLFVSDGTQAGTLELADGDYAGQSILLGETLLFTRDHEDIGIELWRTEGTAASTELVADLWPGEPSSYPSFLGSVGGLAIFSAYSETGGLELWRSDGTAAGSWLVRDIRPGPLGSEPGLPTPEASPASTSRGLFFVADDGATGRELWVTNGTVDGTYRVTDLRLGAAGSHPAEIVAIGERVFFFADDGRHGRELWVTDGSPGVSRLVKDIHPGPGSSVPLRRIGSRMIAVKGRLYFGASDGERGFEPWALPAGPGPTARCIPPR